MASKTECPLTAAQFASKAPPLTIVVNGQTMLAQPREFSTGSFGWYLTGKVAAVVDGKHVSVQIGMNLTVIGSKDAPR